MSIGVFAELVGLTASALRFYDDAGLLRPEQVDPSTGYRSTAAPRSRVRAGCGSYGRSGCRCPPSVSSSPPTRTRPRDCSTTTSPG
ncbi:MerR family DNA-binding transcriptional regulator [Rhodococcus pyridinivorans]|uniref:MerR family DNA-binding transcriptional regulator n=2 Tax=Nocardiaceae TaxID=85025 RepID=UPI001E616610|nr:MULTISPECIES: MerR family DNA-binding transcriptional regulator [Rhodococcus]UVT27223.1 MerR family DNA-binding transcriptional regulator [Rhodococcus pyridinivorans]